MKQAVAGVDMREVRQQASAVAKLVQLPLRNAVWSGLSGGISGAGTGNSLEFQDQRPYAPGDDPRHINWQAYARSGSYTMKMYRQEVSPRVDLVLDASASMAVTTAKECRSWELACWVVESALQLGAALRVMVVRGAKCVELPLDQVMAGDWGPLEASQAALRLDAVPLRGGSLRVLVSDLLFPMAPELLVTPLTGGRGRALILAPYCQEEAAPDWSGNLEFHDAESGAVEKRRVLDETRERYLKAYTRHFQVWQEPCAKQGVPLARIASSGDLLTALRVGAVAVGAAVLG
jgi:uncharacterized protein (DUF58 family)